MSPPPERYRILEHAADGKFRAFGGTIEEAFANAVLACASLMWDWASVRRRVDHRIEIHGRDLEQLLYRLLEEVLYLQDTRSFILADVEDLKIEEGPVRASAGAGPAGEGPPFRLSARFVGDDDPEAYEVHGEVKAVTYNEMKIERSCDRVSVQVVVDM